MKRRVLFGMVEQMSNFEISNGHNWGAIWSNRDETLTIEKAIARSIFLEGSHGTWGLRLWEKVEPFSVYPISSFEPISKENKKTDKAISRISNFSVARECKDPKELENNQKERGKERGGSRGPKGPGPPPLSFPLSF